MSVSNELTRARLAVVAVPVAVVRDGARRPLSRHRGIGAAGADGGGGSGSCVVRMCPPDETFS